MSNTNEKDSVEIVIEETAESSISNETEPKPTAAVTPVVPEKVPKQEARKPTGGGGNARGRQLKPDSNGTRARSSSVSTRQYAILYHQKRISSKWTMQLACVLCEFGVVSASKRNVEHATKHEFILVGFKSEFQNVSYY